MSQDRPEPPTVTSLAPSGPAKLAVLVHGGAGDVSPDSLPSRQEGCARAAQAGARVLAAGGSALDAVEAAVRALEDDPLFNAGTGACLTADEHLELDAAIMSGADLRAGGVCALPPFRNPIAVARRVMEASRHVLLAGEGAARFALAQGFARADEALMITQASRDKLAAARKKRASETWAGGTVGAVARDARGHVAAATSTGGMVNKLAGRVGDSPIVGAGTYADDEAGACSTTGHGEAMMRVCLAKVAVDALAADLGVEAAARDALALMHRRTGERGGLILVAPDGSTGLARTTRTMSWAAVVDGAESSGS